MVYYLAVFSFLLAATAFSEPVNGPLGEQVTNVFNNAPAISTTDIPLMEAARPNLPFFSGVKPDLKCPHTVTLLQLLATLLEFLHHSVETDKKNKVVAIMKNNINNIPVNNDKEELNTILKYIEDNLHKNSPLHDYLTTVMPNVTPKSSIIFKTEVPNLTQPNCKNEFSKLMQKAYNDYIQLSNFPNCQHSSFPPNDAFNIPNENQPYAFDINYSQLPNFPYPGNDHHSFSTVPSLNNPLDTIVPFYNMPNKISDNVKILPNTNSNPLNIVNGLPQTQTLDMWTIIKNNPYQYGTTSINQYLKDHPEKIAEFLKPSSYFGGYPSTEPNQNNLGVIGTPDMKIFNLQNHLPDGLLPNPNNNSSISSNVHSLDGNLMLGTLNNQIDATNNNIDYTVLLSQLGLLNKPVDGNNPNNYNLNNNPADKLNNPSLISNNPNILGNDLTVNSYPLNSGNSLNGIPNLISGDSKNIKEAYLDKKRIPLILEYIASSKNLANQNSYSRILNNNHGGNVDDNKLVLPDLSQSNGMTNLEKIDNKAGVIELTYLLKRPQPLVYHPVYYAKYRLPYAKFVQNYRNLVSSKPMLRNEPKKIYQELMSLSNITEVSPVFERYDKEAILNLMVNNGTLIKAKLIDAKNYDIKEQLEIIRELNSATSPGDIHRLTDATLDHSDPLLNAQIQKNGSNNANNEPTSSR